jgi:hypothetical protein
MTTPNIFKSRKFWIMVADVILSTVIYFVGKYAIPSIADDVKWVVLAWQPAVYAVINGIATEDAARLTSGNFDAG